MQRFSQRSFILLFYKIARMLISALITHVREREKSNWMTLNTARMHYFILKTKEKFPTCTSAMCCPSVESGTAVEINMIGRFPREI